MLELEFYKLHTHESYKLKVSEHFIHLPINASLLFARDASKRYLTYQPYFNKVNNLTIMAYANCREYETSKLQLNKPERVFGL